MGHKALFNNYCNIAMTESLYVLSVTGIYFLLQLVEIQTYVLATSVELPKREGIIEWNDKLQQNFKSMWLHVLCY